MHTASDEPEKKKFQERKNAKKHWRQNPSPPPLPQTNPLKNKKIKKNAPPPPKYILGGNKAPNPSIPSILCRDTHIPPWGNCSNLDRNQQSFILQPPCVGGGGEGGGVLHLFFFPKKTPPNRAQSGKYTRKKHGWGFFAMNPRINNNMFTTPMLLENTCRDDRAYASDGLAGSRNRGLRRLRRGIRGLYWHLSSVTDERWCGC